MNGRIQSPIYRLPPYRVQAIQTALAETIDWGVQAIGVPAHWKDTRGAGIRVAVLDTGCQLDHPDLEGAIREFQDFTGSAFGADDKAGHGTHCAGVIAARQNDRGRIGVAPECELLIGKVLGDDGSGYNEWIASGIDWAVAQGARVISMSLGSADYSQVLHLAIKRAVAAGAFVVCAAGNEGRPNSVDYPARHPETIAVSAIDKALNITDFSSTGKEVDVAAPGENIVSAYPRSRYASLSGTSMATPHVTGMVALALAAHAQGGAATPLHTVDQLRDHLKRYSVDRGDPGWDTDYGWGIIDAAILTDRGEPAPPADPGGPEPGPAPPTAEHDAQVIRDAFSYLAEQAIAARA